MKKFVLSLAIVGVLAFASVSEAGRVGGPGSDVFTVQGYQSVSYNITFEGGKVAEVAIVGDGRTDLDLFVYDASGKLIRQGIGPIDIESLSWVPPSTQTYRVVVVNLGGSANRYAL